MSDTKLEIITSMNYSNTDNILLDVKNIIEAAQQHMRCILAFWTH